MNIKKITVILSVILVILCSCKEAFSVGTIKKNTYVNEWAGFSLTAPEDWLFLDAESIAGSLGIDLAVSNLSDKKTGIYYAFRLSNVNTGASVTLTIEDLSVTDGAKYFDAGDYLDLTSARLDSDPMIDFHSDRKDTVKIGKKKYETLYVKAKFGEAQIEQYYYTRKIDNYMLCFVCSDTNNNLDECQKIIDLIKEI